MHSYQRTMINNFMNLQMLSSRNENEVYYVYSFGEEEQQYTFATTEKIDDPRLRRRSSAKRGLASKVIDKILSIADDYLIVISNGSLGVVSMGYEPVPRLGSSYISSGGITFGKRMYYRESRPVTQILSLYDENISGEEIPVSSKVIYAIQIKGMKWGIGSYDGLEINLILEPEDFMEVNLSI